MGAHQFHAALQVFDDAQTLVFRPLGLEGGTAVVQAQRALHRCQAGASGPGNAGGHLGAQAQGLIGHHLHHLVRLDGATGLKGVDPLQAWRRHLFVAPAPVDGGQLLGNPAVDPHVAGQEVAGSTGGLKGHPIGTVAAESYGPAGISAL